MAPGPVPTTKRPDQSSAHGGAREPAAALPSGSTSKKDTIKRPFRPYHSMKVPRRSDLESEFLSRSTTVTTVMLRNIPNRYTQTCLIEEIDATGFRGRYDFFYLPMDIHNRTNVGYAFINFLTPLDAQRFFNTFVNYVYKKYTSNKVACVSPAHVQGLRKNLEHFLNRAVTQSRDSQYRPVVFIDGRRHELSKAIDELDRQAVGAAVTGGSHERVMLPWERDGFGITAKTGRSEDAPGGNREGRVQPRECKLSDYGMPLRAEAMSVSGPMPTVAETNEMCLAALPAEDVPQPKATFKIRSQTEPVASGSCYSAGFIDARKAFEQAVSGLLSQPPSNLGLPLQYAPPYGYYGDENELGFAGGSRTVTPRSPPEEDPLYQNDASEQPDKEDIVRGEFAIDIESVTPRTSRQLLGMSLSLSL